MKAGQFNMEEYLNVLNEAAETETGLPKEGLIIPDENKKSYEWLKKEYNKGKTEVKVEMKMGKEKFEPGYDLQTDQKSVKDFKPGMYGDVKTSDTEGNKKDSSESAEGGSSSSAPKDLGGVKIKGGGAAASEPKAKSEPKKEAPKSEEPKKEEEKEEKKDKKEDEE